MKKLIEMSYRESFANLTPKDQRKINEKVIWAVNELTNLDGHGPVGTKAHIEARAKQLIIDWKREGWAKASKRFRVAIEAQKPKVKKKERISHPLPSHMIMEARHPSLISPQETAERQKRMAHLASLKTVDFPPIPDFLIR
jgi:hypothetical protein